MNLCSKEDEFEKAIIQMGVQDMVMKKGIKFSLAALVVAGALVGCGKAESTDNKETAKGRRCKRRIVRYVCSGWIYSSSTTCRRSRKEITEKNPNLSLSTRWR